MFDSLSGKLQTAFKNLRGLGKISQDNVAEALREVRMALLDADVNFKVARDFIAAVKTKALGADVVASVQPGQQIIKIIHDELVALLGSSNAGLEVGGNPACILMVGLHGSGKTTSSGKLARLLRKQGRQPLLVAADVYRPAAMDQLAALGKQLDIPVFVKPGETDVLKIAREALAAAKAQGLNTLIFDTAGRLQIDEPLVQELVQLRDLVLGVAESRAERLDPVSAKTLRLDHRQFRVPHDVGRRLVLGRQRGDADGSGHPHRAAFPA